MKGGTVLKKLIEAKIIPNTGYTTMKNQWNLLKWAFNKHILFTNG